MDNKIVIILLLLVIIFGIIVFVFSRCSNSNSKSNSKEEFNTSNVLPYETVTGKIVKITAGNLQNQTNDLNLYAVFIYGSNGNVINFGNVDAVGTVSQSTNYKFFDLYKSEASNALNYVNYNNQRTLESANNKLQIDTTWSANNNCSATDNQSNESNENGWWQYEFNSNVNISGIEIYSRSDCCPYRISNALIEIFDDKGTIVWSKNFKTIPANEEANIDNTWETFKVTPTQSANNNSNMANNNLQTTTTIPQISPSQTLALLNSGLNMDLLTSEGIGMSSLLKGPATNIVQTNLTGTSNIYSPYLYYNKNTSEKFSANTYDTGKNYYSY